MVNKDFQYSTVYHYGGYLYRPILSELSELNDTESEFSLVQYVSLQYRRSEPLLSFSKKNLALSVSSETV